MNLLQIPLHRLFRLDTAEVNNVFCMHFASPSLSIAAYNVVYPYSDYIIREHMFAIWCDIDRQVLPDYFYNTISLYLDECT